ncbi:MAG: copper chaperone PCu(A)C [Alphaproteobacteria bacterium]|nr:copper chaperone PCu(A)C [Alphaproteobacteria bacterium]
MNERPVKALFEITLAVQLAAFVPLPAAAQPAGLVVTDAWFRSLPGKLPAAGYFSLRSNSGLTLAVTGAESDGCGKLLLHKSSGNGGMSSMAMVDKVTVPPGGTVKFAPGGYHLMCVDPRLKTGSRMPVTLHLSDGSSVIAAFQVHGATGK